MIDTHYTKQGQLAFRRFAIREFIRPTVDLSDLGRDQATDFLKLSLLSFREHMAHAFRTKRADGTPFLGYPAYLDCISLNAFAGFERSVHVCGINVGLAVSAYEFANFCFAQSTLFRRLGDASQETDPEPIEGEPPGFWIREKGKALDQPEFLESTRKILPRTVERTTAAMMLTHSMIRFTWLHELAHTLNGHVGFLAKDGVCFCLHEDARTIATGLPDEDLRRLEMDADKSALFMLLMIQLQERENIAGLANMALEDRIVLSLFAAYAMMWILEEHGGRSSSPPDRKHPAPHLRQHNLIRTFASNIAPHLADPAGVHNQVLEQMTALSAIIPSLPTGAHLIADMQDAAFQQAMDQEAETLDHLRAQLDPYQFKRA